MSIKTKSKFYYGYRISLTFSTIPFNEGSGDLTATLNVGTYSLTNFITEVTRAMNEAGTQEYTVTVDRTTRFITIAASGNFELKFLTGVGIGTEISSLLGFDQLDFSGTNTYTGVLGSGSEWIPQFILQDFMDFDQKEESTFSVVNESASGVQEVVAYGRKNMMSFNAKFLTNIEQPKSSPIDNNPTGRQDVLDFLVFATGKGDLEFIKDRDDADSFTTCFLEKTSASKDGTGFELKEQKRLQDYYETDKLVFRARI